MPRLRLLAPAAALLAAAVAPTALAGPNEDFQAVYADYQPDSDVTPCRFGREQLVNARDVARQTPDFAYYNPGFEDEVNREIARHDAGNCAIATPQGARSPLASLRITRIRPRGRESVTIKNVGAAPVSLRGGTLRDRAGNRIRFPRFNRIRAGRSLRVFTGCAKHRRRPLRRGSRLYACNRRQLWNDGGDVARLVDAKDVVVSQRGYGRFRATPRF